MPNRFVITSFEDLGFHNATWVFSLGKFKLQEGTIWHRHMRDMTRPYIILGRDLIYADSDNQVFQVDDESIAEDACWSSPMLNRGLRQAEYSLTRVILRYETTTPTTVQLWGTPDGGNTWPDSFKTSINLIQTRGRIHRAIQTMYVTGTDLRFCIWFPNDAMILFRGWSAEIMQRGKIGGLD